MSENNAESPKFKKWWTPGPDGISFEMAVELREDGITLIGEPYYTGWYRQMVEFEGKMIPVEKNFNTGEKRTQ